MAELSPSLLLLLIGLVSKQCIHHEPTLLPFAYLVLLILHGKGAADFNAAKGREATVCEDRTPLSGLTDGDMEESLSFTLGYCRDVLHFSVFLETFTSVHFVGLCQDDSDTNLDPAFLVKLGFREEKENAAALHTCGKNAGGLSTHKLLMVNCFRHPFGFDMVRVIFPISRHVILNEIEVWSIGDQKHKNVTVIHRGCFLNFDKSFSMPDLPDVSNCFEQCAGRNFTFAALTVEMKRRISKEACFCSDTIPEVEVPVTSCDSQCGSRLDACGVKGRFSVYLVRVHLPFYVGCLGDLPSMSRQTKVGTDIVSCLEKCDSHRYAYLRAGTICYCDNDLWEGPLTGNCNEPCENNTDQVCGGLTAASVYSTCLDSIERVKCSLLFKCNERTDELGMCTGDCLPGYQGLHCLVRSPDSTGLIANKTRSHLIDPDYVFITTRERSTKIRSPTKSAKKSLRTLTSPLEDRKKFHRSTAAQMIKQKIPINVTAVANATADPNGTADANGTTDDSDWSSEVIQQPVSFDVKATAGQSWLQLFILGVIAVVAGLGYFAYEKYHSKKKVEPNASEKENSQNASKDVFRPPTRLTKKVHFEL